MDSSNARHYGVKAIEVNRARIKERIQEKHRQQSQQVRQGRLSALRNADSSGRSSTDEAASWSNTNASTGQLACSSFGACAPPMPLATSMGCGAPQVPLVEDWSDIGHEFGVNILDRDVMECLLAIEDEIRQEQLFHFYDETNGCEWEEYYNSLTT